MKYDYTRKRPAAHVPRNAHSRSHKACNRLKKRRLLPPPHKARQNASEGAKGAFGQCVRNGMKERAIEFIKNFATKIHIIS